VGPGAATRQIRRYALAAAIATPLSIGASDLFGQAPNRGSVELEGLAGYTVVDVQGYSNFTRLHAHQQYLNGIAARVFLLELDARPLAVEAGYKNLFWYEVQAQGTGLIVRRRVYVSAPHVAGVIRHPTSPRTHVDFGFGLTFLRDGPRPSGHVTAAWRLAQWGRVSVPLGVRVAAILHDDAPMLPVSVTLGAALTR
jgi:hypothetical protein